MKPEKGWDEAWEVPLRGLFLFSFRALILLLFH